jgi:hypothetical protein
MKELSRGLGVEGNILEGDCIEVESLGIFLLPDFNAFLRVMPKRETLGASYYGPEQIIK